MFLRQPRLEDRVLVNSYILCGRNLSMQQMTKELLSLLKDTVQTALIFFLNLTSILFQNRKVNLLPLTSSPPR